MMSLHKIRVPMALPSQKSAFHSDSPSLNNFKCSENSERFVFYRLDPFLVSTSLLIDCVFEIYKLTVCFPWLSLAGQHRITG